MVSKFKPFACGYIGSSFLTNDVFPEQILAEAKEMALVLVNEILDMDNPLDENEADGFLQA